MPVKFRFCLQGEPPPHPFWHADHLRALVLAWIEAADRQASREIHDSNQPKPYTLSPLWTSRQLPGTCWFEVSVLAEHLDELLLRGARLSEGVVALGSRRYTLVALEDSQEASWRRLLSPGSSPATEWHFRLLTPTAHHARGEFRKSLILPGPEHYFANWLYRWNLYAPRPLDRALLATVSRQVVVSWCAGSTETVLLDPGRTFIGFVGAVRFRLLQPNTVPEEHQQALTALARFATYCGTGVDTMRGMGQTIGREWKTEHAGSRATLSVGSPGNRPRSAENTG